MDSRYEEIGRQLRRITRTDGMLTPIMSGKAVAGSTDTDAMTIDVLLTVDDNSEAGGDSTNTEGVLLGPVSMNNNGLILYPADGSDVVIAEIDGSGNYTIVKCSNLAKFQCRIGGSLFTITDGLIQMNDGGEGGLTITPELKKQLDKNNALLQKIIDAINTPGGTPEPGGGAISAFQALLKGAITGSTLGDFSNIENTKIKQG